MPIRLLPIASSTLLYLFTPPLPPWWLHSLFLVSLALLVESGAAMLVSGRRWEQRHSFQLALFVRLLVLLVTVSMVPVCIACGVWLATMWDMFPQIELYYPDTQPILVIGLVVMVLAIIIALFTLVRSTLALRDVYAASPK